MQKIILLLMLSITLSLGSKKILIVVDKNFKEENLTLLEIKEIFLSKKRFVDGEKILAMNYEFNNPLRECFEKNILKKSRRSLERYWRKAYYKGKRPPKIVKSTKMLLSYMKEVQPSIGYIGSDELLNKGLKVVYRGDCP